MKQVKFIQISKFEGQKGCGLDHMTHFYILGYVSGTGEVTDIQIWCTDWSPDLQAKTAKIGQKGRGLRHVT